MPYIANHLALIELTYPAERDRLPVPLTTAVDPGDPRFFPFCMPHWNTLLSLSGNPLALPTNDRPHPLAWSSEKVEALHDYARLYRGSAEKVTTRVTVAKADRVNNEGYGAWMELGTRLGAKNRFPLLDALERALEDTGASLTTYMRFYTTVRIYQGN